MSLEWDIESSGCMFSVIQRGHMAVLFKFFEKPPHWISLMAMLAYTPPAVKKAPLPPHPCQHLCYGFLEQLLWDVTLLATGPPGSICW